MFAERFDSVVMLAWSDWKQEPRSNRYHYASRFRRLAPVIFVQPDLPDESYRFEETELEGVTLLHLCGDYASSRQCGLLAEALRERRITSPLLWIYNAYLSRFILNYPAALKVYHGTEDYFSPQMAFEANGARISTFRRVLQGTDLLVACSEGVLNSYVERGGYQGPSLLLENGCDYSFYAPAPEAIPSVLQERKQRVAIYQGGINRRLDFQLLDQVIGALPDWTFWFCGALDPDEDRNWRRLVRHGNVVRHGLVSPERLRDLTLQATVGLIPFVQEEFITERSLPLKAFEYAACGLPVVSVPIRSLEPYGDVFVMASSAKDFVCAMQRAAEQSHDEAAFRRRLEIASQKDYDVCFQRLIDAVTNVTNGEITHLPTRPKGCCASMNNVPVCHPAGSKLAPPEKLKVLVLYDDRATRSEAIRDHLGSLGAYSRNDVFYAPAIRKAPADVDLAAFDAVIVHNSVQACLPRHLSPAYARRLKDYAGVKVLLLQDDNPYDPKAVENTGRFIEDLGMSLVLTTLDAANAEAAYPQSRFPTVRFVSGAMGVVPGFAAVGIRQRAEGSNHSIAANSSQKFVESIDELLSSYIRRTNPAVLQTSVTGIRASDEEAPTFSRPKNGYFLPSKMVYVVPERNTPLVKARRRWVVAYLPKMGFARQLGMRMMPEFVKRPLRRVLGL